MQEHNHIDRALRDNPTAAKAISETIANQSILPERCVYCGVSTPDLICDDCDRNAAIKNQAIAQRERREREAKRLGWFVDKVPEIYRTSDDLLVPGWSRALTRDWHPAGNHGVTIQGASNTWKTRAATKLLEKAFVAGLQIEFRQAGDLRREINRLARDGADSEMLRELCTVPVLLLDDLGNQAFTETAEEFMLALLEGRTSRNLPTITTTQFPGDEFLDKFSNRRIGMAICRRIGPEKNWMVNSKTGQITPPRTTP